MPSIRVEFTTPCCGASLWLGRTQASKARKNAKNAAFIMLSNAYRCPKCQRLVRDYHLRETGQTFARPTYREMLEML